MGSRGNIVITQHPVPPGKTGEQVYLYTHFGGECLPELVQQVLARRLRWDDEGYLARMLFAALIEGDESGDSGAGITTYLTDNEFPLLVLDCKKQQVSMRTGGGGVDNWSFEQFVRLPIDSSQPWTALGYDSEADEE